MCPVLGGQYVLCNVMAGHWAVSLTLRVEVAVQWHMQEEGRKVGRADAEVTFAKLWRGLIATISASTRTNITVLHHITASDLFARPRLLEPHFVGAELSSLLTILWPPCCSWLLVEEQQ